MGRTRSAFRYGYLVQRLECRGHDSRARERLIPSLEPCFGYLKIVDSRVSMNMFTESTRVQLYYPRCVHLGRNKLEDFKDRQGAAEKASVSYIIGSPQSGTVRVLEGLSLVERTSDA